MAHGVRCSGLLAAALLTAALLTAAQLTGCSEVDIQPVEHDDGPHEICLTLDDDERPSVLRSFCGIGLPAGNMVDVLFVIDDGPGALALQRRLAESLHEVVAALRDDHRLLDVRIGFTTSDDGRPGDAAHPWGSGGQLLLQSCHEHPDDFADGGAACAALCPLPTLSTRPTESWLGDEPRPRPWIELSDGATNLPTGIEPEAALRCAALLGEAGSGLPAPLQVAARAQQLAQDEAASSYGFFRYGAVRLVVPVTAGPECSMTPEGSEAFDPGGDRALWPDPQAEVAPLGTCHAAGTVCVGTPFGLGCEVADIDLAGAPTDPEHATLWPLAEVTDWMDDLAHDHWAPNDESFRIWALAPIPVNLPEEGYFPVALPEDSSFGLGPVCELDGTPLRSPLRLAQLSRERREVSVHSTCADDWSPLLEAMGAAIVDVALPGCLPACVADFDEDEPGLQPDCRVEYEWPQADGTFASDFLPECEQGSIPADAPGCWEPRTGAAIDPSCDEVGLNLELRLRWAGGLVPTGVFVKPTCTLSKDEARDCPGLR
jgi:hypothetical protein